MSGGSDLHLCRVESEYRDTEAGKAPRHAAGREGGPTAGTSPVLLDPVGVGVSRFRMEAAAQIVQEIRPDVIRGNGSEIRMLAAAGSAPARGVDADLADAVTEDQLAEAALRVKQQAEHMGCILAVTGRVDLIHGRQNLLLYFQWQAGDEQDYRTGCQLSGLTTAFLARIRGRN